MGAGKQVHSLQDIPYIEACKEEEKIRILIQMAYFCKMKQWKYNPKANLTVTREMGVMGTRKDQCLCFINSVNY